MSPHIYSLRELRERVREEATRGVAAARERAGVLAGPEYALLAQAAMRYLDALEVGDAAMIAHEEGVLRQVLGWPRGGP